MSCPGVVTARDEWVYDVDTENVERKARFFSTTYNRLLAENKEPVDLAIKWSRNLRRHFDGGRRINFSAEKIVPALYRPFVSKWYFADSVMSNDLTRHYFDMFGSDLDRMNSVIFVKGPTADYFSVLSTNKIIDFKCGFNGNGGTFAFPLHLYKADGQRVSNITAWGLRQFREHYGDESITAEDIFAYTYAALHDPAYRQKYEVDLRREFPRLPFHDDFATWVRLGQKLLDLHIGFESAEPWPLERVEGSGEPGKAALRANKERGAMVLDGKTTLAGVPPEAWEYRLGSRSALEWVLDQYRERPPRDPTIREKFNTYRFADHKERVIDLLQRVCTVSVETVRIVDELGRISGIDAGND